MHDKYIEILPQISDIRVLEDMFKYSRVTLQGESVKAIALADSLFDRADELSKTSLLVDKTKAVEYYNLSKQVCLFLAPHLFDRYCIYLEWDREPKKRFYLPRRKVLKVVADDMQDLYDGKIDFLSVSLPPRVGKSTLGCFYMSWLMGKHPELSSLMVGYSDKLTKGFYREVYNIIADDAVYLWRTIFPENVIVGVSAEDESISINAKRRYPTLTCRSISGSLTGIIDITLCLYCDDLISDLEEAINPNRLQSKYDAYANQLKDRMKLNSFQLMIGTRWSPNDVQGVIEEMYRDNPKYRFRVIPALDDNGNSNFDYPYELGFTTEHFLDIKKSVDAASWSSKYMGNPSPREGLLYPEEDLKYYNGTLPDGNYVVWSACDIAWGGGDHLSQGFLYVFENGDVYVHDVVHNPGDKGITKPLVVAKMIEHQPAFTCFEANNGGHEYADDIERILRTEHGVRLKIESRKAPTTSSKLVRMLGGAVTARNWYFRDRSCRNDEYKLFMRHLTQFNQAGIGKQPDDAPDMLSQAERFIFHGATKVEVFQRPI